MIVQSESNNYEVTFSWNGHAPPDDDLGHFGGKPFSTHDRDNDSSGDDNCAEHCGGGFWYNNCDDGHSNINLAPTSSCGGFSWDKYDPDIELQETKLYLMCGGSTK